MYIYICIVALLCNDREMRRYTRAFSGYWLGKHVPFARQQILNNAAVGLQEGKRVSAWSVLGCYKQGTRLDLS
jgi:hypothetical protein